MSRHPIRAASRLTGLSIDTLRAWERRYGAVIPERSDRGRLYTDSHITRLRNLGALVAAGHPIGAVARLSDADIVDLLSAAAAPRPSSRPVLDLDRLIGALESGDLVSVESTLTQCAAILAPRELVFQVIAPALHLVGERWAAGLLAPWQEHLVSASMRSVLGSLIRIVARPGDGPPAIFATPRGERHEMGLLCAALLAAARGVRVIYLGPDLSGQDIADAATHLSADLVVLGLAHANPVTDDELQPLIGLPAHVRIWVGGTDARVLTDRLGARATHVADLDTFDRIVRG